MPKQPSVAQIFEYTPGAINLTGFPSSPVLESLQRTLGSEALLKKKRRQIAYRNWIIDPSFSLEYVEERQDLFKRLGSGHKIRKTFFDRSLPKPTNSGIYQSYEEFLELCNDLYGVLKTARKELKDFEHIPEAKRILSKVRKFDSRLELMLKRLDSIEQTTTFAVDTQRGVIVNLSDMPSGEEIEFLSEHNQGRGKWERETFNRVRLKMKKQAIRIAKEAGIEFRRKIMDYVKGEFRLISDVRNLRRDFEQVALPIRLYSSYNKFLEKCENYPEDVQERLVSFSEMPDPVYPSFSNHYNIRGLFPPQMMDGCWGIESPFVPIDFKSKALEKKFLIAGLHSGGKSFFLENMVLLSILGQAGFNIPTDSLTLPRYNRIFYYRNTDDTSNNKGKLETELSELNEIICETGKGDLVVIDEFLDSTSVEIANSLGSAILDKLAESKATVFVTSHRNTDYERLSKNGWVLMSPDYEIKGDKVRPTLKLTRGPPNEEINKRYILERYSKVFE